MSRLTGGQKEHVRTLLADLVRIPSDNESNDHGNRVQSERAVAEFVERRLNAIGMAVTRYSFAPGRDNLVATWPDQTGARSFALQAHMDTVGVSGMTIDPFAAEVRDGRMWGRGTCDTKGALAAFLAALELAAARNLRFVDRVQFVATVAEETGCCGAEALSQSGFMADGVVVGEPTNCSIITAHKGTLWLTLETTGRTCHSSLPHLGRNAIYGMSKALRFITDDYIPSLRKIEHPLLGFPTLSVNEINGGRAPNIVPANCAASLDFRIVPGQAPDRVHSDFLTRLRAALPGETFATTKVQAQQAMETPPDAPWVSTLMDIAAPHTGQTEPEGVNYFADSGPFCAAGMPCIVFGPGDIAQAHTADEYIELDQLYRATEIAVEWLDRAAEGTLFA